MTNANDHQPAGAAGLPSCGDALPTCANCATLRAIVVDLQFWARRYADGRMTYVTGEVNQHTRTLLAMGIELIGDPADGGTVWSRDGMGRDFDGLTDVEAAARPALLGEGE